jgi:hypothetical protein
VESLLLRLDRIGIEAQSNWHLDPIEVLAMSIAQLAPLVFGTAALLAVFLFFSLAEH